MNVEIVPLDGRPGEYLLECTWPGRAGSRLSPPFTEHELNDVEFALAQRKAMSKHCAATDGEHSCVMPPNHGVLLHVSGTYVDHVCRACKHVWKENYE